MKPGHWASSELAQNIRSQQDSAPATPWTQNGPSRIGRERSRTRSRRSWVWNQFFVIEEYTGPEPVLIGKLHTDMDREDGRTKYLLSGEGAGTIFVIDEYSGNIHVTKSLDREEKAQYTLTAQVVDRQTLRPLEPPSQFIIKVQDINDNPPVFLNGPYTASIPEMANLGTSVIQVTATDADDPTYGNSAKLVYTVLQGQPYFSVDPQTGVVRTAIPSMDRETQDHFVVVLQAKDMGGHMGGLSGTATITVTLTDVNDNPPKFTQSLYSFSVSELAQPLAHVGRVRAEDPDIGENAEVQYAILDEEHSDTFNVSAYRGDGLIVLNRPLDFEHRKSYTFRVEATNTHIDPHYLRRGPFKDVTTVKVSVLDADEPPQFSESSYTFNVLENSAAPAIVGHVSAKDPDNGGTVAIRFSIDPRSDPERFFIIGPQDGIISTTTPLDREAALWHNITVVATEVDNPAQSSRIVVSIRIMDLNDNPPELEYNYQTAICDTDLPGTLVQVLKAVDRDEHGNETQVHFSLAPESRGDQNFTVTDNRDNTASVFLHSSIWNRPVYDLLLVPVLVWDNEHPPLSSTGMLTVSVCHCGQGWDILHSDRSMESHPRMCLPQQMLSSAAGLSTGALLAILACIATLLVITTLFISLRRQKTDSFTVFEEEDIRENIITYDDEGGGEEDTEAFDIAALQKPDNYSQRKNVYRQNLAHQHSFLHFRLSQVDNDTSVPPYDSVQIYGFEGQGSLAGSLSSLGSQSEGAVNNVNGDVEVDRDAMEEWGPQFEKLAGLCGTWKSGETKRDS
uniref:Cadherin-24-like n=1 Tax=Erpetoichthys calabaricus TaxID=27687 RepID=A0A8C4SJD8_ERPCA